MLRGIHGKRFIGERGETRDVSQFRPSDPDVSGMGEDQGRNRGGPRLVEAVLQT